jgi:MutS domain V
MNSFFTQFFGPKETKPEEKKEPLFQLPIEYLDPSTLYPLQSTVVNDLELVSTITEEKESKALYDNLFLPKHEFAKKTVKKWQHYITTNTDFLKESQQIIHSLGSYHASVQQNPYDLSCTELTDIWNDIKEDPYFLERYSYMEIEMLKSANTIPAFLQAVSVINMGSPVLSLFIPFIMFLMPFVLIKIQGHPITFDIYLTVLKEISRNHFIGKIISSASGSNGEGINIQNIVYLLGIVGLYIYQIYQNWLSCTRFYKNIHKINTNISVLKNYLHYSIQSMESFCTIIENKPTYNPFMAKLQSKLHGLKQLYVLLNSIQPFSPSLSKIGEIGNLLSCYYQIYSVPEYYESLAYSFEFEGYINNLLGVYENVVIGRIAFATYSDSTSEEETGNLVIKNQYYPALTKDYIVNDICLDKNMTITGPNAAGKTTYLKTTVINIIYSQQVGAGFYSACSLSPYTHIHSYLNIPDTSGRDSLFQAESRRCKEILGTILQNDDSRNRHFCIFDELYSGTNPGEAAKSAYAFLSYLSKMENVDFILTTHYVDMCERFENEKNALIENWQMEVDITDTGDFDYKYTISRGISKVQGAIKVLKEMDYPREIIDTIEKYDLSNKKEEKEEKKKRASKKKGDF